MTPAEARQEAETEEADLLAVMSTPSGRRLFFAFIERAGVTAGAFDPNPHTMAFLEGRRSVGIDLLQRLQQSTPQEYLKMMIEAAQTAAERNLKQR